MEAKLPDIIYLRLQGPVILFFFLLFSFTIEPVSAQTGSVNVGGGIFYGTPLDDTFSTYDSGFKLDGYYTFNEVFDAGMDISIYFPTTRDSRKQSKWNLNLNGHYIFFGRKSVSVYGIAGFQFSIVRNIYIPRTSGRTFDHYSNRFIFGLNAGTGIIIPADFYSLFGEIKYTGLGLDAQIMAVTGVRFRLN